MPQQSPFVFTFVLITFLVRMVFGDVYTLCADIGTGTMISQCGSIVPSLTSATAPFITTLHLGNWDFFYGFSTDDSFSSVTWTSTIYRNGKIQYSWAQMLFIARLEVKHLGHIGHHQQTLVTDMICYLVGATPMS